MKKTITQNLKIFMTLCLLLFGVTSAVQADEVTMSYTGSTTNMTGDNDAAKVGLDKSLWSVVGDKGGNQNYPGLNKAGQIRLYGAATNHNSIIVTALQGQKISSITVTYGPSNYNGKVTVNEIERTGEGDENNVKTYDINNSTFTISHNNNSSTQVYILSIVISYTTDDSTPVINASNVTLDADTEFGEIKYSISNPVEGKSISASTTAIWISNFAYTDSTVTFTTTPNTTTAERTADITLKYDGATDKLVKVTQAKPVPTYASLAELVDAGEPTETGETVKVTLTNDTIKDIYVSGTYRNGVFLNAGNKEIEIYCRNVPETWKVGGTLSGTLTCLWKKYNDIWELCPDSWEGLEYAYNVTTYKVICDTTVANGTISADLSKAAAGDKVTLTIKPNEHYYLDSVSVKETLSGNNVELTKDYTFIMPACDVTVSATFAESAKYYVIYTSLGEEVGDGEEVYAGECIAKAPEVTAPEGWEFAGWTADENFTTSTAVPTYFTDETPVTQDTILYAVFSKGGSGSIAYHKVTTDLDDWRGDYLIAYSDEIFMDGSLEGGTNGVGKAQSHVNPTNSLSGNTILAEWGDKYYVTLEAIDDSDLSKGYVIKSHSDTTPYFYHTRNDKNGMSGTDNKATAATYPISVIFNDENDIDIALGGNAAGAILHYNNDASTGDMFRFYKDGGQQNIYLYKKDANTMLYTITNPIYTRSGLTSNNLGTICLPCDATITGAKAYEISSMTMDDKNISSITFFAVEKVEGGKGYLFVASGSELTAEYISEVKTEAENNNGLVGSLEGTDVDEGKYIINNNKVKKCGTCCKIAANRAYIDPAKYVGELPAKGETITIELETPTSINELMQKVTAPGQWYNLNGQPVAQPTKGVFTKNGVKYIFK